jgi:hypothetical protein
MTPDNTAWAFRWLEQMRAVGIIDSVTHDRLAADLDARLVGTRRVDETAGMAPTHLPPTPASVPQVATPVVSRPTPAPEPVAPAARFLPVPTLPTSSVSPPAPVHPVAPLVRRPWWARVRAALGPDAALHALAYLGVALMFAGVTGLVVFAFGDVQPRLRPVAEVAIPLALLAARWLLRKSGASFTAALLAVLGAVFLPLVAVTALLDDVGAPPDARGLARPFALGAVTVAIGLSYWWWTVRRAGSHLRHVVVLCFWLGVALVTRTALDLHLRGTDVARPSAAEFAVVLAAMAATLGWCTSAPRTGCRRLPSTTSSSVFLSPSSCSS